MVTRKKGTTASRKRAATASRKRGVYGGELEAYNAGYKRGYKTAKAGY